jgi:N6-L-threonylcarbamoyladenine synthase
MLDAEGADRHAFSFSGLKTAVLRAVQQSDNLDRDRADLARGFQDAAIDVMVGKAARALEETAHPTLVLGGGVACNQTLAERMRKRVDGFARVYVASPRLNTDNAAMIAAAGAWHLARGDRSDWALEPKDNLPFPGLVMDRHTEPATR